MAKQKILSKIINVNEYILDIMYIGENIHKTYTLAQSYRLAWLLEPIGANLRASGVFK